MEGLGRTREDGVYEVLFILIMKKQIVVIHGGNAFDVYEGYLNDLKNAEVTLERFQKKDWKSNLQEVLGQDYDLVLPRMPNSQNARYLEWKIWFEKIIPLLDEKVVFIGHSLGGIFLAKYLSENTYPKKIRAIFLVAAPYNDEKENPYVDFNITASLQVLTEQSKEIFIYHSKDDQVVPFSSFERYTKELPEAKGRVFEDKGHFNQERFDDELVEDIRSLN